MLSLSNIKYFFATIPFLLILKGCRLNNQTSVTAENKISYSDPHSFALSDGVFLKHLNLNLEVDFKNKIIEGWAEWDIKPGNADTLILDTRDLNVSSVVLDEHIHSSFLFGANDPTLGAPLLIPITASTTKVKIFYKTSPEAAALQWLNPSQTRGKKLPFLYTQSQAILARSWIPCKDSPGIKFTYEATIKVPDNLMALMSAVNDTSLHSDGIYHFNMPYPVPSYLMALTTGNLQFKSLGNTCGVYAEPEILPAAAYEFADLKKMILTASDLYGPYEWGRYDVVIMPPSFPFGGMENPRLTFATPTIITGDRSLVSLVAHELAHSWSGNLVTNVTWDDFWLNEGFTVYFENRIMETLYGREYADMHELIGYGELKKTIREMGETNIETALKQNLKGKDPDDAVNDIAYEKGRFFLLTIEKAAGRNRWDSFVKEYFKQYRFQSISTSDFLTFLNQKLIQNDKELAKKINQNEWVNKAGLPAGFPEPHSKNLDEAKKASDEFVKGKLPSSAITQKWHTFQWLHFLRNLPEELTESQMTLLDKTYHFTQSKNAEILCDWFQHAIRNNYQKAFPSMENFLCAVGRRKFIQPLYALMKEQNMTDLAKKIYAKAKPGYHQVSSHTIDQLLYSE